MKKMTVLTLILTNILQGAVSSETLISFKEKVNSFILSGRLRQDHFNAEKAFASASRITYNNDEEDRIARKAWAQDRLVLAAAVQLRLIKPTFRPCACPSVLYVAIAVKDFNMVSLLLSFTNVNAFINKKNETLLHIAVLEPDRALMRCLLDKGANPNAQNNHGFTPLHILIGTSCTVDSYDSLSSEEVLIRTELLLKAKANRSIPAKSGRSAEELATMCRSRTTGAKLTEYFKTLSF